MIVRTKVFEIYGNKYENLSALAQAMGISVSQVYRVREGKRKINQKFIVGAIRAFPGHGFSELFYISEDDSLEEATIRVNYRRRGSVMTSP